MFGFHVLALVIAGVDVNIIYVEESLIFWRFCISNFICNSYSLQLLLGACWLLSFWKFEKTGSGPLRNNWHSFFVKRRLCDFKQYGSFFHREYIFGSSGIQRDLWNYEIIEVETGKPLPLPHRYYITPPHDPYSS